MADEVVFKCTMIMEGREHGWTESYWISSTELNYAAVMREFNKLADKRSKLLGNPCYIKGLRVSRQDETGEGLLTQDDLPAPDPEAKSAAQDNVALLIRVGDIVNKKRKHIFLRGIWDDVEGGNGEYIRNFEGWQPKVKAFVAHLTDLKRKWGWWGVTDKTTVPLAGYTVGADQRLTFTAIAPVFPVPTFGKRSQIRLSGVNGRSKVNGLQVVDIIDATHAVTYLPVANVPYVFGGRVTFNFYGFIQAFGAQDMRITTRKSGAPLLESRGRLKAKSRV